MEKKKESVGIESTNKPANKKVSKFPKVAVLRTLYCSGEYVYPGEVIEFKGSEKELNELLAHKLVTPI